YPVAVWPGRASARPDRGVASAVSGRKQTSDVLWASSGGKGRLKVYLVPILAHSCVRLKGRSVTVATGGLAEPEAPVPGEAGQAAGPARANQGAGVDALGMVCLRQQVANQHTTFPGIHQEPDQRPTGGVAERVGTIGGVPVLVLCVEDKAQVGWFLVPAALM